MAMGTQINPFRIVNMSYFYRVKWLDPSRSDYKPLDNALKQNTQTFQADYSVDK